MMTVRILEVKITLEKSISDLRKGMSNLLEYRPELENSIIELSSLGSRLSSVTKEELEERKGTPLTILTSLTSLLMILIL